MEAQNAAEPSVTMPRKKRLMWISIAGVVVLAAVWAFVLWRMHSASPVVSQAVVSIGQKGINPATITINVGQAVVVVNRDVQPHSLAADAAALPNFSTVEPLNNGDSHSYTFDKKGTYRFYDPANPANYAATVVVE